MIVGWKSPLDGRVYPLDDCEPLHRVIPEPVLRAMSLKAQKDKRHSGAEVTITGGLSCPRKTLITRMMPVTPDPSKMWKMQRGTWLHEMVGLSLGENHDWWTEEVDEDACIFNGELFGVQLSCKVDALRKDYGVLMDWKFRGDGAEKWIDPQGRAKDEDSAQLNMARMLIEQRTQRDLSSMEMYVWVMAGQTVRTTVPYLTEEQVGMIHPGGGSYTIKEIIKILDDGMRKWKEAADNSRIAQGDLHALPADEMRAIVRPLPMVGERMYSKRATPQINMCTRYCEVQDECYGCNGGI